MGAILAGLLILAGISVNQVPLSAQAADSLSASEFSESAASLIDESVFVLGETPSAQLPEGGSSVFVMLRMVLVLALAALAIYGIIFIIKRLARPRQVQDPYLKVLARVPLGNETFAAVVSVGAKAWLVGGGSSGVNLISEIDDAESLETMLLDDARKTAEAGTKPMLDFRSLLGKLGRPSQAVSANDGSASSGENQSPAESSSLADKLRRHRERLKGL